MAAKIIPRVDQTTTTFREQLCVKKLQEYLDTLKETERSHVCNLDKLISDSEYLLEMLQNLWDINEENLRLDIQQDISGLCKEFQHFVTQLSSVLFDDIRIHKLLTICIKKYCDLSVNVEPNITVCFTPEEKCLDKILDEIRKARLEILIQAYTFDSMSVANALKEARRKDVAVKMLIDKECSKTPLIADLERFGVAIEIDHQKGVAHNKVMIIDDVCIITGSYNWTVAAETKNSENVVIIRNECVTSMYKDNFLYLENMKRRRSSEYLEGFPFVFDSCDGCSVPVTSNLFAFNEDYIPADYSGNENLAVVYACFTPRWKCLDLIVSKIKSAEKSILVHASCFTLEKIANALINSKKKGVDVQLLIDKSALDQRGQQLSVMAAEDIPVIIHEVGGIAHSKVIIIDDDVVLTGSYNLSKSADNRNSENVIFIKNTYVNQIFKQRWCSRAKYGENLLSSLPSSLRSSESCYFL